jgi:hypothetical protein
MPSLLLKFLFRNLLLFWWICLYKWLVTFLAACSMLSLFCILNVLTIIWHEEVLFWSCLFGILNTFWTVMTNSFLRFGEISAIISLNMFSVPIVYTYSLSSVPLIYRFSLLMVSQRYCKFCSYFFIRIF